MPSTNRASFDEFTRAELLALVKQLTAKTAERANKLKAQENSITLSQQLLKQRSTTLEKTYEAVHNGPLQELAVLLRDDADTALDEPLRSQLKKISQDLRGIYQSMRLAMQDEAIYLQSGLSLDLDLPLEALLQQVFEHTLSREFPGYASLQFLITPDFTPLAAATFTLEQKRGLCVFFQEALCNVGKHAVGTTRLTIICSNTAGQNGQDTYCLSVTDNGQTPSVIESLLQSLTSSPADDCKEKHQGTRQAEAIAQQLNGKFKRYPNSPQGTICELCWPC